MKAVVILFSILAFAACLLIGIQAGSSSNHPPASPATDTPNPWISPSEQRTILVIVADDLSISSPHLEAVWLALYRPDLSKVTLIPLYPTTTTLAGTPAPDLSGAFSLTSDKKPSKGFYKALTAFHVQWNGYLLFDRSALSLAIDWMQGIQLNDSQVTGPAALASLTQPAEDRQNALTSQKRLLGAICQRTSSLPMEANWVGLADSLKSAHLSTDLQIQQLVSDWKAMMSAASPFSCDVPVP
jgi:hypothetical protein